MTLVTRLLWVVASLLALSAFESLIGWDWVALLLLGVLAVFAGWLRGRE